MQNSIHIQHEVTSEGYYVLSAVINGLTFSQKFHGFTLTEAKEFFKYKFKI